MGQTKGVITAETRKLIKEARDANKRKALGSVARLDSLATSETRKQERRQRLIAAGFTILDDNTQIRCNTCGKVSSKFHSVAWRHHESCPKYVNPT